MVTIIALLLVFFLLSLIVISPVVITIIMSWIEKEFNLNFSDELYAVTITLFAISSVFLTILLIAIAGPK